MYAGLKKSYSERFLSITQAGAAVERVGGQGVAQEVRVDPALDVGPAGERAHELADVAIGPNPAADPERIHGDLDSSETTLRRRVRTSFRDTSQPL